jgi:hypothetical protein
MHLWGKGRTRRGEHLHAPPLSAESMYAPKTSAASVSTSSSVGPAYLWGKGRTRRVEHLHAPPSYSVGPAYPSA